MVTATGADAEDADVVTVLAFAGACLLVDAAVDGGAAAAVDADVGAAVDA